MCSIYCRYLIVYTLLFLLLVHLLFKGNCSENGTENKHHSIHKPLEQEKRLNHSHHHFRTRWKIEHWIEVAASSSQSPQNVSNILPITPFAVCILQFKIDPRIFQWTKLLPSTQFTVFFLEDMTQTDELFSYTLLLKENHSSQRQNKNRFVIRINKDHPQRYHYTDMNFFKGQITAWDKAIFFFSKVTPSYKFIWIFEDDVLVPTVYSFLRAHQDAMERRSDMISNTYEEVNNRTGWHWHMIPTIIPENIPYPYYAGMMCALGFTPRVLHQIELHAHSYHQLDFLEALFPTLAMKANLSIYSPPEFSTITFYSTWPCEYINTHLWSWFHPVKQQAEFLTDCIQRLPMKKIFIDNQSNFSKVRK